MSTVPRPLRRVHGPSAVGGGWRRFLSLTWLIATTDFRLSYFGSVLGYLWSFMQPLLFFGVLYLVFAVILAGHFAKVRDFPVLLLMNIVLFSFFQQATGAAVASLVLRENLVRKMQFPRLVVPLAVVSTAAMQLVLNLMVVVVFMLVYGVQPRLSWLLLPIVLVPLWLLTSGAAMLLSALYVRYRDVAPVWGVISQALFYSSPIFILVDNVPEAYRRYYLFNPIAAILQQARHWMVGGTPPGGSGIAAVMGGWEWLLVPMGIIAGVWALGFWTFSREAPRIAEEL